MFDNQKLWITFGPVGDILFTAFLILGCGAFSGIIINYIVIEFRAWLAWFKKDEKANELEFNRNEHVWAEPRDPENDAWQEVSRKEEAVFEATGTIDAPEIDGLKPKHVFLDEVLPNPENETYYFVHWSTDKSFDAGAIDRVMRTSNPGQTALEMLAEYGSGHIRWRLAGDDIDVPDWKYQGFYPGQDEMENVRG